MELLVKEVPVPTMVRVIVVAAVASIMTVAARFVVLDTAEIVPEDVLPGIAAPFSFS